MLPETIRFLEGQNLAWRGMIATDAVVEGVVDWLMDHAVIDNADDVPKRAAFVAEIRHGILGDVDDPEVEIDLDRRLIGPMLTNMGKVHHALPADDEGIRYCLCAHPVTKRVSLNGNGVGTMMTSRARYVSTNPDLIVDDRETEPIDRLVRSAARVNNLLLDDAKRVPELAKRREPAIARTRERIQLEMPLSTDTSA